MRCGVIAPPPANATDEDLRERIKVLTSLLGEATDHLRVYAILNGNEETLALCHRYYDEIWHYNRVYAEMDRKGFTP